MTITLPQPMKLSDLDPDALYTPAQVAPLTGFKEKELRRYCIESGFHTRITRQKIMLDQGNARDIIAWVKAKNAEPVMNDAGEIDYFK
ncbi:hypothetical protein ART_1572 [Arthrobacter sp. PAMC 25486]|uniref:hypothetical protein n=1 Tax=Arthrobacter sp. PAMC 25486 TaxID=1494608 RepID=UPI0005361C33|nr:hypothetical protein [Arthrobacter sp. PAMC 25486]AIY01171.1 hypothetical protein ART_1572 [Arthrobacter sp. PAMC 25486]